MRWPIHGCVWMAGLGQLQSLHLDDCEGAGRGDWAFLRSLQGLTCLSWGNRYGGPSWFASEAELDKLPRANGLVREATALSKLARYCLPVFRFLLDVCSAPVVVLPLLKCVLHDALLEMSDRT